MAKKNGKHYKVRRKLTHVRITDPETGAIRYAPATLYEIHHKETVVASIKKRAPARAVAEFLNKLSPKHAKEVTTGFTEVARRMLVKSQAEYIPANDQVKRHSSGR